MTDFQHLRLLFLKWTDPRVEPAWKAMETGVTNPFLHYDYLRYTFRFTRRSKPLYRIRVACVLSGEEIVMLLPLKGSADHRYWKMLGDIQGCDRTDALWKPSLSAAEREELARFLYSKIPQRMSLHRIQCDSPLLSALPQERLVKQERKTYVRISVPERDPDTLLKSLSSSVRQNIRTAYNRMRRDGVDYRFEVFDATHPVTDEAWGKIMDLYFDRIFTKYKSEKVHSWLGRWKMRRLYYRTKHDTLSLHYLPNSWHAVLWNGDRVMAFMNGLTTRDGTSVSVPRLAIDAAYSFYSPGYVLITDAIRHIAADPTMRELDLSRGDEKYKFDMGGQVYTTSDIDLSKSIR